MEFIKKIVTNSWFLPVISLIFTALLIWFAGPYIAFAEYYPLAEVASRLIVIISILLIYTLIKLISYHKSVKLQQQMVSDIAEGAGLDEVINAENAELKKKFDQAFSLLKNKKSGASTLTDLPWYMIIGSPGSGKTTLLSNSGLKFPLANEFSNQAIQGVGGTKNCDWWLTQEAVLLDTAGRYTSRDSHQQVDETGWHNFLTLIKKYRKKPISGLLVSFSLSDLLTMNDFEIGQQINQTKQRISELNQFFNTKFPVYVIVTKCDMLAGFTQFFENFSHKEREQAFGITFSAKESSSNGLLGVFKQELSRLLSSLSRRQWQRISLERDASRKALIYSFTNQLASLKPVLNNIVESLTDVDGSNTNGILRGVYFTSGTQHGAPIDRMIAKVSQTFGLKSHAQVLWNNDTRSYFIKELLSQVIFPESDQFGVLAGYEKRNSLIKRVSFAIATVCSILLGIGWFVSYNNNVNYIETSLAAVENWSEQYQSSESSGDIRHYLPALNDFSANLSLLEQQKQASFSGLGLAQSSSLQESFDASYTRLLKIVLLPFVKEQIEAQLASVDPANPQAVDSELGKEKYLALKAYLMLGDTERRDVTFLSQWLSNNLKKNATFSDAERIQLTAHTDHLINNEMPVDTLNAQLIDSTRLSLQRTSLTDLYYQQFKLPYLNDPKHMMSMAQIAGPDWRNVFSLNADEFQTMSVLYTPNMLTQVQTTLLASYISKLNDEKWILGDNNQLDISTLAKQLLSIYAKDYTKSWQTLLANTSIKTANNVDDLQSLLAVGSAVDSPILALLDTVSKATLLTEESAGDKLANMAAKSSSAVNKIQKVQDLRSNDSPEIFITSNFTKLHELMRQDRKTLLHERMATILSSLALSLSGRQQASDSGGEKLAMDALQTFAFKQPAPLNNWLDQLSASIGGVASREFKVKINTLWQQDIMPQCADITANKYPFVKNAKTDTSTRDLATLFAESGILHQFFTAHIEPLIQSKAYPWRWKEQVAANYGFSDNVLPFFEQVDRIRKSLFVSGGNSPQLNLALKPIYLDPRVAKFKMNVYGQQLSYQFGRPTISRLTWPPENPSQGSIFSFVRQDGSEINSREEDLFAIFKLFDAASINTVNSHTVEVTFMKDTYKAIYEVSAEERASPMIFSRLAQFRCINGF